MAQATVNAPPEFTPAERQKRYVSLLNVQAAQNTVSRSDMPRFSKRRTVFTAGIRHGSNASIRNPTPSTKPPESASEIDHPVYGPGQPDRASNQRSVSGQ